MSNLVNRRNFLKSSVASAAVLSAPAILSAKSPNETVRVAGVGVGGKGWTDINGAAKHADVVAYCDVDTGGNRKGGYGNAAKTWENATGYTDFRKMIEKEHKNLDGITVSTPDHMHAPVTMMALKHGLAVYTQKPLTRTISEARALTLAAAEAGVSTQMGNQHHSGAGYRTLVEIIQSGKIGKIKTAHSWSNRPVWPQGLERPTGSDPIPKTLDWNLWLGVAQERPFKKDVYHAFKWRGWFDFGAGALGDMGCHIIDPVVWSLDLGPAKSVSYVGPKPMEETFPKSEVLQYKFPGTQYTAGKQFTLTWHDGGKLPPLKGSHVPASVDVPANGVMLIGETGTILCAHGKSPTVYAQDGSVMTGLPKVDGLDHYGVWVDGIKTGKAPNSSFAYAGPMTETVLLGVVAARMGAGELKWDSKKMAFTNSEKANQFVHHEYRSGWEIKGL